jgi:hypothetical protein
MYLNLLADLLAIVTVILQIFKRPRGAANILGTKNPLDLFTFRGVQE